LACWSESYRSAILLGYVLTLTQKEYEMSLSDYPENKFDGARGMVVIEAFVTFVVGIVLGIVAGTNWKTTFKAAEKIEPTIELVITNNQVDSLYVYDFSKK
jgi:hypothetical protein